jgi:ABC-2 type transport system ATP-binding protein
MGNTAIVIKDLVKRFEDITALDGLTLEIRPGELFGLLGPNGAGKTTLINILAGIRDPTKGSVTIAGFSMPSQSGEVKDLIGVCPQDTAVYDYLTGRENVELFGALHAMSSADVRKNADDLLDKLSLSGDADRRVGKFSGGMRRRINLIMALVHDPQIAFLDEPTVAMDPQSRRAVWDFIKSLRERGKTIILTTHYMEEAEELCDRVGIIDHGKLIALGSPGELRDQHGSEDLEEVFIKLTGRSIREGV